MEAQSKKDDSVYNILSIILRLKGKKIKPCMRKIAFYFKI